MALDVALVGTGGMMPLPNRWLSSVLIRHNGRLVLFDCGEGTQISLRSLRWGANPPAAPLAGTPHRPTPGAGEGHGGVHIVDIDLVLISHLHGDHVSGLPGLLLTQGNSGRTEPVRVLGPPGLSEAVERLRVIAPHLPFEVHCQDLKVGDAFELASAPSPPLQGRCAAAEHQILCLAYRLDVPRGRRFLPDQASRLGVPVQHWSALQAGQPVELHGELVEPDQVLGPPRRGLSVGLVTDTRPTASVRELVHQVDLLVCEAMYGDPDDQARAIERKHLTFPEAACLAKQAAVGKLVLTHFSPSLSEPQSYLDQARTIFPDTVVGEDHLSFELKFPPDD